MLKKLYIKWRRSLAKQEYYDYNLLATVILLSCFGLIMLYSTSAYSAQINHSSDMFYFKKQAGISAASLVIAVLISQIDYHWFAKFSGVFYLGANFLLFITKFVGTEVNGARRWLYVGPINFQPSEIAKVAIILFLPYMIVKIGRNMKTWKAFFMVAGTGFITFFLTYVFTENLSTAIIIAGIVATLLFVVFPKVWPFTAGLTGVVVLASMIVMYVSSHGLTDSEGFRLKRVQVWLNPGAVENSSVGGYQVMQGLYAIGSGGLFGKGLGNSLQKLSYVPEAQNDMIFTIICEELGVFGALMLILLFIFMLYRLLFIANNAPDLLGSLIATGVFAHIALQVIFNIAVVTNSIPTTGITLPFVSYGGTSIVFLMVEMGIALSVSKQIKFKDVTR
ncbi:MAG: putative peptidoglycan glycosyltransferase FtsW [Eubacteriales bacterium]|nr:putative peptidoglycan glycosyltransferase FtsW [Eubacteriales bacterium]